MRVVSTLGASALLLAAATSSACLSATHKRVGEPPPVQASGDPAVIARGAYLAKNVARCEECHSERDWAYVSGPVKEGTEGIGGQVFGEDQGYPGTFVAGNLTPVGLGEWTDAEIAQAIVAGLHRDGGVMFPVMAYPNFRVLTAPDLTALVSWIRTLPPLGQGTPPSDFGFPMGLISRTIPEPWAPATLPEGDEIARGRYLATVGQCVECHSQTEKGRPIAGLELAGGRALTTPAGDVVWSSNLTPDPETGLGAWTREVFVARFKAFAPQVGVHVPKVDGVPQTVMPWAVYAGMSEEDLGAIYAWLRTVPAVPNLVDEWGDAGG